ncbi:MAG TPA: FimV/HubP family polar landmark protein [Immundisolibacter sp.]|nr:FimV/HubP family polar landmark protein [Immundisolibacter sp.]
MAKRKRFGRVMAPALLLPLGLAPLDVQALGLGALRVNSALGQPLDARIELVGATPAEAELATVSLASAEVHQRLGIDSTLGGVMLRFAVKVGSNGQSYVAVSSHEPVREPYVDFVVQAVSPTGQVARHYTVLLDPVGTTVAPTPASSSAWSPLVTPIPEQVAPRPRPNPFANVGLPKAGAVYGPVPPGATLWAIARRVRPGDTDLDAVMSSIVRANPQAFIDGDPARLKAGSRLSIPDAQALRGAPAADAEPQPQTQTPLVAAAPAPQAPVEQPAPSSALPTPNEVAPTTDAEVRVLRSEDAKSATAVTTSDAEAPGNRVQLLEEALDAAQQQNESLQQRMSAMEAQIRTLTELVKAEPNAEPTDRPVEQAATGGAADSATPASPASPAVPASVAPAEAAAEADGGSSAYLAAAVAALGVGGLLLWMRRRKAAANQFRPLFDDDATSASGAAAPTAGSAGIAAAPATRVEWVEPVVAQPVPVETSPSVVEPTDGGFGDPVDTQIDLLTAYVGMADGPSARQIHDEIQRTGTPAQKAQAAALLARLGA